MLIFNLASKEDIAVKISGTVYQLPRFQRAEWKAWQKDIDEGRIEDATKEMDDNQRAQFLMLYPLEPITFPELRKRVNTLEGSGRVFTVCAERGSIPAKEIKRIVEDGDVDEGFLQAVALMLASMADPAEIAKRIGATDSEKKDEDNDDTEDPNDPLSDTRVD